MPRGPTARTPFARPLRGGARAGAIDDATLRAIVSARTPTTGSGWASGFAFWRASRRSSAGERSRLLVDILFGLPGGRTIFPLLLAVLFTAATDIQTGRLRRAQARRGIRDRFPGRGLRRLGVDRARRSALRFLCPVSRSARRSPSPRGAGGTRRSPRSRPCSASSRPLRVASGAPSGSCWGSSRFR